jgi:hypothetical protein
MCQNQSEAYGYQLELHPNGLLPGTGGWPGGAWFYGPQEPPEGSLYCQIPQASAPRDSRISDSDIERIAQRVAQILREG